ncbi:hypothetical protein FCH28_01540 [Streptomyces piniterrae]|uniref:Uncharacterized protein n=1 Tax=Streptomyces piniterrae TaxID=2571125 RepID=A0A4U0NVY5_9ACTN|nr:hypothetical protein [Streptomyces piniterrae]TJZ58869.1 hypothetical protein FCH28_01540 [Streptomyces piniterrae]
MTDPGNPPLQALPDGDAELRVVLRLQWEDVAALGREAARLAAQLKRPVTLDEAASHRLRTRSPAVHAKPPAAQERPQPAALKPTAGAPLPAGSPGEQARQAIERINGSPAGSGS